MKTRTLTIYTGMAVVLGGLALFMVLTGPTYIGPKKPMVLLPELKETIGSIDMITVKTAKEEVAIKQTKDKKGWQVVFPKDHGIDGAEAFTYPADRVPINQLLLAMSELKIVEQKTKREELYSYLGLEGLDTPDSKAVEVSLSRSFVAEKNLPSVNYGILVGKNESSNRFYVRERSENPQTWLIEAQLKVKAGRKNWINNQLVKIDSERIKSVEIKREGEKPVMISRQKGDKDFKLFNVPTDRETKPAYTINSVANMVVSLSADDLVQKEPLDGIKATATAQFETFDGQSLLVSLYDRDGDKWVGFWATPKPLPQDRVAEPEEGAKPSKKDKPVDVLKEAKELNSKFDNYRFKIPSYQMGKLETTVESLLKPLPKKAKKTDKATPQTKNKKKK